MAEPEKVVQPSKTLVFKFNDTEYTITFPNNKEYLAIQNLKAVLAPNADIFQNIGAEGIYAESLADVEAHLTVLCPKLIKDLAKTFGELTMIEGKQIVEAYSTQFRPWYNQWLNFIFRVTKEEDTQSGE